MEQTVIIEKVWVNCPVCGQDDAERLFSRENYQHVRCRNCTLVYVNPQHCDTGRMNAALFGQTHQAWVTASQRVRAMDPNSLEKHVERLRDRPVKKYARELKYMEKFRKSEWLLDVGCADGKFLMAAAGRGWSVSGVEIAPEQAALCRERLGLDVRCGMLHEAGFESGTFDVVRLNQVIEHVAEPRQLFQEIRRVLRPGGLLSLATVNINSFSYRFLGERWNYLGGSNNEHIVFFSRRTLDRILSTTGFKSLQWKTNGCRLKNPGTLTNGLRDRCIKGAEKMIGAFAELAGKGGRIHVYAQVVRD
ncbi:MAG: class I SAM-dependent methyltransferase [Candidatus Abyssobacteria bacterium SURF_5]|uniref:Class I SAM-dependent methyltransferase n=1 Tax=Abyssobacteria bacterium (strain SURF_5) TaxID=2093360 RepID=A0A3A4P185_ABYX5|nr:MAG: class I SAM-dependent methyltransferase [Candidatus Abyssubacteria bacterium SURF_5]